MPKGRAWTLAGTNDYRQLSITFSQAFLQGLLCYSKAVLREKLLVVDQALPERRMLRAIQISYLGVLKAGLADCADRTRCFSPPCALHSLLQLSAALIFNKD